MYISYYPLISSCLPSQNRCEEVARCTCELKRLAREVNLPVVVASQLKRVVGKRLFEFSCERHLQTDDLCDEGFPQKDDLLVERFPKMDEFGDSEIFSICEEADVVLLLHRPEYYLHRGEDENGNDIRGLAEVYIVKKRHGETGYGKIIIHPPRNIPLRQLEVNTLRQ